jgi:hypothetical protein
MSLGVEVSSASMMTKLPLVALLAAVSVQAAGKEKAPAKAPKVKIELPAMGALPETGKMKKLEEEKLPTGPTVTPNTAGYSVVRVLHGTQFVRSANGATPVGGAMDEIVVSGNPPSTPKFTTVVRVRCKQRVSAPIEVALLDPRGDIAMNAIGEVSFRGVTQDEVDYTVDWDPTPTRAGGAFQIVVKVAGEPMGTWPIKLVEKK